MIIALLRAHGITSGTEEKTRPKLSLTTCPRCGQKAGPENQFCPKCGMALSIKAALKLEKKRSKADHVMNILMRDKEVRELLARKLKELYVFLSGETLSETFNKKSG